MTPASTAGTFGAYVDERNLFGARLAGLLVAVLMPAGFVLDWITHPSLLGPFLALRALASVLSCITILLTYTSRGKRFIYALGVAPGLIGSATIAVMIHRLEGYASPYYAGLNLCILGMGIVFTWRMRETILACVLVMGMWLVPALFAFPHIDLGPFFNNFYFLALTSVIAVASNETRFRQAKREYEARAEVARTSEQLTLALARLREMDRLKNEFFANISHELRTPLTLILSPVEERLGRDDDPPERPLLEVIRRNAHRLLRLIDDLLDLARIDAGHLRLSVSPVDLRSLTEQSRDSFRPAAEAKGLTLALLPSPATRDIFGDPHRLEMVLSNLLGNAMKFTPAGGSITLAVTQDPSAARISVSDTGPGIAAADLPQIFDRFYQVEGSARRAQGGVGIGLALARELCELHGGRLEVVSEKGKGTTFTIVLPVGSDHFKPELMERRKVAMDGIARRRASDTTSIDPALAGQQEATPAVDGEETILLENGRKPRVLVAEDNDDLREFLEGLIAPSFEVSTAVDGAEALEKVRTERPDLVISDVMMPHMTGVELCAAIKADPTLSSTPVILLTARTGTEAVLEGYSSGADDFVAKPVHPRVLIARVRAQLKLRSLGLELAANAKLAAVGTLAAGVGHEVRNPINAILNGTRTLLAHAQDGSPDHRLLEVVLDAGHRIEAISSALLDHAAPAEHDLQRPCDVRIGIDATLKLLAHRMDGVQIHKKYETDKNVLASAGELNQVFLNLIDNAVRSSAKNVWIGIQGDDGRVKVSISDDGPGIPRAIAARIFDPFFTTRQPGEGTGLGLYLSRRIVKQYGGDLRLDERPGGGAAFTVDLPEEHVS